MKRFIGLFLLTAALAPPVSGDVYNDNVVIVLDASGSMKEDLRGEMKMEAAKRAIVEALKNVPATTQVGLLVFSGQNKPDDWLFPLGPRNDAALLAALSPLAPNGGTPLGAYLKIGADRLLEQRVKQFGYGSFRMLIVTDGQAGDPRLVDQYAPEIIARGIVMDVIGVAMAGDHILARRARSYRKADDAASLEKAIADVMAEVQEASAGQGAASDFELLEGLPAGVAAGMIRALVNPENHPIGGGPPLISGDGGLPAPPSSPSAPYSSSSARRNRSPGAAVWIIVIILVVFMNVFSKRRRR